ncbi:hypothetical protein RHSIM_Rhsim05G0028400 [Rhododendron simsii]|uniref:Cell wall hydroxyproline-rich glycoprotein n=1 Tax=Rhododendron simsii TaxID=118357 RepID=A0A834LL61_RHOSS|nr:hypothetical protein RHSIM_Rhsim05G0028400 [Rhododendron simsii]
MFCTETINQVENPLTPPPCPFPNAARTSRKKGTLFLHQKMAKSFFCFLCFLLLQIVTTQSHLSGCVSISIGGGRGAVWIGRGITRPAPPDLKLSRVYTALQAWKSAITDDPNKVFDTWVGSDVCGYTGVFCVDPQDGLGDPTGPTIAGRSKPCKSPGRFGQRTVSHHRHVPSSPKQQQQQPVFGPFPYPSLLIPNLEFLDLRFNNFSGPIPEAIFDTRLDAIFLNNNQFEGQIPSNLGNSPASVINLANNRFSGNIPFSLVNVGPRLKEILFINNQLTGCIPEGTGFWQDLRVLDVSRHSLSGHLPVSISCLNDIEVLNLAHNRFSGELSDSVCSQESLVELTVASNFFSDLGHECGKLSNRNVHFDFSANCFPWQQRQRLEPECSVITRDGLNCRRIPGARPIFRGALDET